MAGINSINIHICSSQQELERIVGRNTDFNIFFSDNYAQFCNCRVLYMYSSDYVIPVLLYQKGPFRSASLLSEPYRYANHGENVELFINYIIDIAKVSFKLHWISETPAYALFPVAPKNALAIPFGSHIVNLEEDVETLWSKVHSKHRNVIKKAEKEGVQVLSGIDDKIIKDYHSIDIETWERSKVKASGINHLKEMTSSLKENIVFYVAYKDDIPQAGAIFYFNRAMCYYMHGASRNHSSTGSGNLLHWVAMQDMKAAGVKRYSFVGARINEDPDSKYHGIQRFKERFGGELFMGKRFKVIFNPWIYKLFVLMTSAKQSIRNKRWCWYRDSIDTELPKWK